MSFGHIMRFPAGELTIELAPLSKSGMEAFVTDGGMQYRSVTMFLNSRMAPVVEDEMEWYDKVRTDPTTVLWGIYDISGGERVLIGSSGLHGIDGDHVRQATSGILIFRKDYWGKGIASAAHRARTLYAFEQLGLHRIKSAVVIGNEASYKALWGIGYETVCIERNTVFVDGRLRHQRNLELLNPSAAAWRLWWGSDKPTTRARKARERTLLALDQARSAVQLL